MANRSFHKPLGSLYIDVVALYAKVTIGASGAPTLNTPLGKGIASVTRDSAGQYKINLEDQYQALLWCDAVNLSTTASDPTTDGVSFRVEDDQSNATVPYVQVQFSTQDDGAAADPKNGQVILFKIELRNSTLA